MWRVHLDDRPRKVAMGDDENPTESKVLSSPWFSGAKLAHRKEVLRGMRGNLHGGHR